MKTGESPYRKEKQTGQLPGLFFALRELVSDCFLRKQEGLERP